MPEATRLWRSSTRLLTRLRDGLVNPFFVKC